MVPIRGDRPVQPTLPLITAPTYLERGPTLRAGTASQAWSPVEASVVTARSGAEAVAWPPPPRACLPGIAIVRQSRSDAAAPSPKQRQPERVRVGKSGRAGIAAVIRSRSKARVPVRGICVIARWCAFDEADPGCL
jgi:hypothetical protein